MQTLMSHDFVVILFLVNILLLLHKYYFDTKINYVNEKVRNKGRKIPLINILPNVFEFIVFAIFSGIPYLQIVVFLMLVINFFMIYEV
jgi:hypothetical protein